MLQVNRYKWRTTLQGCGLVLLFAVLGSIRLAAAENNDLAQWTGLWCSGRDEIGIFTDSEYHRTGDDKNWGLYLYVRAYVNDASAYTVEGPASPDGKALNMIDGNCRIHAEIEGANLLVTDDGLCDKMSGAFRRRGFIRLTERIPVGLPRRMKLHCSSTSSQ